jgi:hypothetical protein
VVVVREKVFSFKKRLTVSMGSVEMDVREVRDGRIDRCRRVEMTLYHPVVYRSA